mmetsp:Transcript_7427/g.22600  ORF Transcript_7427/g.22600 Transcript_7427/m.22600 type:complete len:238 (-) Transcript_7427:237-950(-)
MASLCFAVSGVGRMNGRGCAFVTRTRAVRQMPAVAMSTADDRKSKVSMPPSHDSFMLRNVGLSSAVFAALKFGIPLRPNPLASLAGFYTFWMVATSAPFIIQRDRMVDIASMKSRNGMNTELLAPKGFTQCDPPPRGEAEVFDCSPEELRDYFFRMLKRQKEITFLSGDDEHLRYGIVQTTPTFRFPDVITVQFLPAEGSKSTLAIFSTSIFGAADLGKNKNRVDEWMQALDEEVSQ